MKIKERVLTGFPMVSVGVTAFLLGFALSAIQGQAHKKGCNYHTPELEVRENGTWRQAELPSITSITALESESYRFGGERQWHIKSVDGYIEISECPCKESK